MRRTHLFERDGVSAIGKGLNAKLVNIVYNRIMYKRSVGARLKAVVIYIVLIIPVLGRNGGVILDDIGQRVYVFVRFRRLPYDIGI